jgi:hypothetical protein
MQQLSAQAAVLAFTVFVSLYGVRIALSEGTRLATRRRTRAIRFLDIAAVLAAVMLVGALAYHVADYAVSAFDGQMSMGRAA